MGPASRDHLRTSTPFTARLVVRGRNSYGWEVVAGIAHDGSEDNWNRAQVWAGQADVYCHYYSDA